MRILIISWSYFPLKNARAYRWTAIAEYWVRKGIDVDVVTTCSEISKNKVEHLNGVTIYRVNDPLLVFRQIAQNATGDMPQPGFSISFFQRALSKIALILKRTVILFRWPDFAWFWMIPAFIRIRRLFKKTKYNGIISVAHPFTSHCIAWLVQKTSKNHIPWICDYGDPFSYDKKMPMNNFRIFGKLNKITEKKIMLTSKKITLTTENTRRAYAKFLHVPLDLFFIIPPLIPNLHITHDIFSNKTSEVGLTVKLVFTGTLYSKIRNPQSLLLFLQKARRKISKKLEIHFFGHHSECMDVFQEFNHELGDWVFLHNPIDRLYISRIYSSADILVNIGNNNAFQLPSKTIEYMSTGLPILQFTTSKGDLSCKLLKKYNNVFFLNKEDINCEKRLEEFCLFILTSKAKKPILENIDFNFYSTESISSQYLKILEQ